MKSGSISTASSLIVSKKHGHCILPEPYKKDNSLGRWLSTAFLAKTKDLTSRSKELLDDLGFVWKIDKADADAQV
jgi:hypothetical protein